MPEENVQIVREMFEAYVAGEDPVARLDPGVVWNPADEVQMQGIDAVRAHLRRWESEWKDLKTLPEEVTGVGDRVLVTVRFSGRGRQSGIEIDARLYELYTLRGGKIVRMDEFTERAAALEAAGLSE